ncbi:MAG TPA: FapA family protein, partial [Spirochaetia bacterium]|nr:FapA family protein [Spirochaetia bacterium]
ECGGDLVTNGGILGRVQSMVKVGGNIRAKFIENCSVEAGGDITVSTGCLNSTVNTLGSVTTGNKGVVIGGRLCAQKGVTAFQIGSSTGVKTEICVGEDYRARQKLAWIRERNAELAGKLKVVETSLATRERGNPKLAEMRDKLKAAIQKMNDSARSVTAALASYKDAAVSARGDLHLGVTVEICRVPFLVTKPMGSVRLVLDKTSLVVSAERLGRA